MSNMLTATQAAIDELTRIATDEGRPFRVRLAMKGGGCSGLTIDMGFAKNPTEDEFDLTFTQDGVEFIIDKKSAFFIQGATLDFGGGLLDRGFHWEFPDAKSSCGCGTSFSF